MFRPLVALIAILCLSVPNCFSGEAQNAATARAMFAAFNAHDIEGMIKFYAPDAEYISPDVPPGTKGHDAIRKIYGDLFRMIPDVRDDVTRVVAEGDTVAVEFVSSGSLPTKPGQPVRKFSLPIASFLTFNAKGLIVRDASYFDK